MVVGVLDHLIPMAKQDGACRQAEAIVLPTVHDVRHYLGLDIVGLVLGSLVYGIVVLPNFPYQLLEALFAAELALHLVELTGRLGEVLLALLIGCQVERAHLVVSGIRCDDGAVGAAIFHCVRCEFIVQCALGSRH